MIFAYAGRLGSEARIQAYAGAGFNVVGGEKSKLDLCRKYGLRLMAMDVKLEDVPAVSRHPALWGYHIIDEPLHHFPALARIHQAYRKGRIPTIPITFHEAGGGSSDAVRGDRALRGNL